MASDVFYATARCKHGKNLNDKLALLFDRIVPGSGILHKGDLTAIKVHWGEKGNLAFLAPQFVRTIVDLAKSQGARPFITDTNTLYRGSRGNAVDNLTTAIENGFDYSVTGAPLLIADGLRGDTFEEVTVNGEYFEKVKIATGIHNADSMIVMSHFKGHEATGFGAAIKNLGMGCASPSGKQNQHSDVKPTVSDTKCLRCGACIKKCPGYAISFKGKDDTAVINPNKCIGCAECVVICPHEAIKINWKSELDVLQKKMAEYACGAALPKRGRIVFFNFILRVSPDCDCYGWNDVPIIPDLGILASTDPVAIDQASVDLANQAPAIPGSRLDGKEIIDGDKLSAATGVDWRPQVGHAEILGLGSRSYNLITVE